VLRRRRGKALSAQDSVHCGDGREEHFGNGYSKLVPREGRGVVVVYYRGGPDDDPPYSRREGEKGAGE